MSYIIIALVFLVAIPALALDFYANLPAQLKKSDEYLNERQMERDILAAASKN